MSNQFLQFIEEIASTDWEYGDGVSMTEDARKHLDEFNNLAGRVTELEQQLAGKDKQLFEENLQVKRLEAQLQRYQGGVDVEAVATLSDSQTRAEVWLDELPYEYVGKRVRVLVMEVA